MEFVATPSAYSHASQVTQAPPCLSCLWLCWSGSSTAALVPADLRSYLTGHQLLRCPSFAGCVAPLAASSPFSWAAKRQNAQLYGLVLARSAAAGWPSSASYVQAWSPSARRGHPQGPPSLIGYCWSTLRKLRAAHQHPAPLAP